MNSVKSGQKDHLVEGQVGLRSPKARNDLRMLKTFQRMQVDRLAVPKRQENGSPVQLAKQMASLEALHKSREKTETEESPRSMYLRKTTIQAPASPSKQMFSARGLNARNRNIASYVTNSVDMQRTTGDATLT